MRRRSVRDSLAFLVWFQRFAVASLLASLPSCPPSLPIPPFPMLIKMSLSADTDVTGSFLFVSSSVRRVEHRSTTVCFFGQAAQVLSHHQLFSFLYFRTTLPSDLIHEIERIQDYVDERGQETVRDYMATVIEDGIQPGRNVSEE